MDSHIPETKLRYCDLDDPSPGVLLPDPIHSCQHAVERKAKADLRS